MTNKPIAYLCFEGVNTVDTLNMARKFVRTSVVHHGDILLFSPCHAFSFMNRCVPPEVMLEYRLSILDISDCLLIHGKSSMSDMCMTEKEYAIDHRILIWDMDRERRLPEAEELRIRSGAI